MQHDKAGEIRCMQRISENHSKKDTYFLKNVKNIIFRHYWRLEKDLPICQINRALIHYVP